MAIAAVTVLGCGGNEASTATEQVSVGGGERRAAQAWLAAFSEARPVIDEADAAVGAASRLVEQGSAENDTIERAYRDTAEAAEGAAEQLSQLPDGSPRLTAISARMSVAYTQLRKASATLGSRPSGEPSSSEIGAIGERAAAQQITASADLVEEFTKLQDYLADLGLVDDRARGSVSP